MTNNNIKTLSYEERLEQELNARKIFRKEFQPIIDKIYNSLPDSKKKALNSISNYMYKDHTIKYLIEEAVNNDTLTLVKKPIYEKANEYSLYEPMKETGKYNYYLKSTDGEGHPQKISKAAAEYYETLEIERNILKNQNNSIEEITPVDETITEIKESMQEIAASNNIIYQIETRSGGSITKNFNNKVDAMNYYNENKLYNVIYRELIPVGQYYYSNGNNCIAIYNHSCEWLCKIKNTENITITEEYIKESLNNYFSNYMPVFGDDPEEIEIIDQVTNNEIAATNSIESIQAVTQNIPELNSSCNNNINDLQDLQSIKDKINSLDKEIDQLEDQYKLIQNNRISLGYSLAIYKCDDIHALKLIKIDKQIKVLEQQQDQLRAEYNQLFYAKYKEESLIYHAKFNNNKYEIIYNNDTSNKIYTNNIDQYKNKAIQDGANIIINEYIDYNKTINIEVNKPILVTIYKYDSNNKTYFNVTPRQLGYASYKEEITNSNGNIVQLIERGYTASNKEVYTRLINVFKDEIITIHKPYDSGSYITITKYKGNDIYYVTYGTLRHKQYKVLPLEAKEIIYNTLKSLSSNKQYKYDIDYIKEFMSV